MIKDRSPLEDSDFKFVDSKPKLGNRILKSAIETHMPIEHLLLTMKDHFF